MKRRDKMMRNKRRKQKRRRRDKRRKRNVWSNEVRQSESKS